MSKQLILASASPRRKELLDKHGIEYEIVAPTIEEVFDTSILVSEAVEQIALAKASFVKTSQPHNIILAADTIVVCGNIVLGKPKDEEDAFYMLTLLSSNSHQVITGVCILDENKVVSFNEITTIKFRALKPQEIRDYISSKEPFDKAGAYAIQGMAQEFVEEIIGDYDNVVGLPITRVIKELKKLR